MRKISRVLLLSVLVLLTFSSTYSSSQSDKAENHTDWVFKSLEQMQTIQVGMSREDLLKLFKEEGGLSTRTRRKYVYRECPYVKVEVEFEPIEAKENKSTEYLSDRITKISKPFLEKMIID